MEVTSVGFWDGFVVGFSILAIIQWFMFYTVLYLFSGQKVKPKELIRSPPLTLFSASSSLKGKLDPSELSNSEETCRWFNEFINRIYFDHIGLQNIRSMILQSIESDIKDLKEDHPTILESLDVEYFSLGWNLPELRNVRMRSTDGLKTDLFVVFDLSYRGGASVKLRVVSFGKSLSIQVSLAKIEGKLITEVINWPLPYMQIYFFKTPRVDFSLRFGGPKSQWFGQLLTNKIKQMLLREVAYPNGFVYNFTYKGEEWQKFMKERIPSITIFNQPGFVIIHFYFAEKLAERGDYFCNIRVGRQKFVTKIKENTLTPNWDETFCFDVRKSSIADDSIKIQMKNGSKDETVGVITIPLASLTPNIVAVDIKSMFDKEGENQIEVGKISLGILLTTNTKSEFLAEISQFQSSSRGSLTHIPFQPDGDAGDYIVISEGEDQEEDPNTNQELLDEEMKAIEEAAKNDDASFKSNSSQKSSSDESTESKRRGSFSLLGFVRQQLNSKDKK